LRSGRRGGAAFSRRRRGLGRREFPLGAGFHAARLSGWVGGGDRADDLPAGRVELRRRPDSVGPWRFVDRPWGHHAEMRIAITGGYVVPVAGAPIEGGTVLIEGGRIAAVGAAADVAVPGDAEIVDADGLWVLPGFVEAHGHA